MEKVTNLDESKILGYFETIKCNFFTKLLFLENKIEGNIYKIIIPNDVSRIYKNKFGKEYELYEKALLRRNTEIKDNLIEEIITLLIISSWICFELIIKDITKKDYVLSPNDISVDYKNKKLGLNKMEKKNLDLFYYIRNAIVHCNGAYYASKSIDHTYKGIRFQSKGKEGEKIIVPSMAVAFSMHSDIENYAYKAWSNYYKRREI